MTNRDCDRFTCSECGQAVVSLPAIDPPPTVCGMCRHLDEFVADPRERAAIRERLRGD